MLMPAGIRLSQLPKPMRWGVLLLGFGGVSLMIRRHFGNTGMMIALLGVVVVGGIIALYMMLLKKGKKRKAAKFGKEMQSQSAGAPQGVSEAEQIAKVDDMRRKFDEGMACFKSAGKDVYSLPWYMIVGEPGSGKTEAVRHSNVGFPPGLQDELQGVGGTINMNWWFTNHAVLLDLAGRLIFETIEPGKGNEWTEFLKLLRAQRPDCPVNGLLLVIPADSLIKDTPEEIQSKAQRLSQQMDLITRTLDIRFPVFVAITKCDLINGFREFFDDLNTPDQQHQMFGWSNPQSIDERFNAENVTAYLADVRKRVERRRLGMLQDPTPSQDLSDRRFDEVDTLYDFPHSFDRVVPALKSYLQLIFTSSEWSAKPLFLRGIYFTSSMREGAALDAELAEALGVPVESLPEGRVWERDRSYFLRDVFMNKMFPEWGLVTRATNVRKQHTRRRAIVLGSGIASVLVLILLTWLGGRSLAKSIGTERDIWNSTAKALSPERGKAGQGLPIVVRKAGKDPVYVYNGSTRVRTGTKKLAISKFHQHLQSVVQHPIRIPWIFRITRPFDSSLNRRRMEAHRISFELSVLSPLVSAVRDKMANDPADTWSSEATAALAELVRIEAAQDELEYPEELARDVNIDVDALFRYVLSREDYAAYSEDDSDYYGQIVDWCYSEDGGKAAWPPKWLSAGVHLERNEAIDKGVTRFIRYCSNLKSYRDLMAQMKMVSELFPILEEFRKTEAKRYTDAETHFLKVFADELERLQQLKGFIEIEKDWQEEYALLKVEMGKMDTAFTNIESQFAAITLCTESDVAAACAAAISNIIAEATNEFATLALPETEGGLLAAVEEAAEDAGEDAAKVVGADFEGNIGDEIRERAKKGLKEVSDSLLQSGIGSQFNDFATLYSETLALVVSHRKRFPAFEPIRIPEEMRVPKLTWDRYHALIARSEVAHVHEDLEKLCRRIDDVFTGYGEAVGEGQQEKITIIRKLAADGLECVASRVFRRECEQTLENWSRMSADSMQDRETVLATTAKDFRQDYMNVLTEEHKGYAAQYWDDFLHGGLVSLADDALMKTREVLPTLQRYARFPLDLPEPGEADLSVKDLAAAVDALNQVQPMIPVEGGKTLGEGAELKIARTDHQIERLRSLELGDKAKWIASAKAMLASIPTQENRRLACKIWLPTPKEQQRLLDAFGKGEMRDDSVLPVWTVMELVESGGRRTKKYRTHQAKSTLVGRVMYPGDRFEFDMYRYHSDTKPDRTVQFEGTWAALRMLHTLPAEQSQESPNKWNIQITLKDETGHERTLWLSLEFEQPLPAIKDWPKYE